MYVCYVNELCLCKSSRFLKSFIFVSYFFFTSSHFVRGFSHITLIEFVSFLVIKVNIFLGRRSIQILKNIFNHEIRSKH